MSTPDTLPLTVPHRATLLAIAAEVGTPVYVYDAAVIRRAYRAFAEGLAPHPHAIHYALKANSTLALVRLLRALGAQADANSGGEIEVALRAGFIPDQIVFTGVGKTGDELDRAVSLGVKAINAESPGELDRIAARAVALSTTVRVALRVNPDIDAKSHPHISTGLKTNKFGMPLEQVRQLYRDHARQPGLEPVGLHIHVGSQITSLDPLRRAAERAVTLARELRDDGIQIEHLDLGGGLGISYDGTPVPTPAEYAAAILPGRARHRLFDRRRARACAGGRRGHAADARDRPQAICRRPALCRAGCRHDRADAPRAVRRLPPDRPGVAARGGRAVLRSRRARCARAATSSGAIGACRRWRWRTSWRSSTRGRMAR